MASSVLKPTYQLGFMATVSRVQEVVGAIVGAVENLQNLPIDKYDLQCKATKLPT